MPFQDLRPAVQDDEAGGVSLRLDQLGQGIDERLRALVASIRADAKGRYDSAAPGWRARVEWTLLWIQNTVGQLTEGRP